MVVFVLLLISMVQGSISYTLTFGTLSAYGSSLDHGTLSIFWLVLRLLLIAVTLGCWLLNRKRDLFRFIILTNSLLTLGLFVNMLALVAILSGYSAEAVETLLTDVVLMAVSNVLIFSIWYWIIDPPGVMETQRDDAPWDFLFPQRAAEIPNFEHWMPKYTDYLYLAFTTSFAFSPTDTLPLTRRAKLLMLLQSAISLVTITAIAGSAINTLASAD